MARGKATNKKKSFIVHLVNPGKSNSEIGELFKLSKYTSVTGKRANFFTEVKIKLTEL